MTGSRILLLVGILAGGTAVETAYQVREHLGMGPFSWRLFGGKFYGPHHVFEQRVEKALEAGTPVSVENEFGNVDVKAGAAGKVEIVLRKDVYIGHQAKARAFADRIRLRAEIVDGQLRVDTNRDELERQSDAFDVGFETHFDLRVPPGTRLAIKGAHGEASVEDAGETAVDNSYGDVRARRVAAARITARHGNVELQGATGEVSLDLRHGDATVEDVPGSVQVSNQHGGITAERTGALSVDLKYGDLAANAVSGTLHVRGEHAGVEARQVSGTVEVESSYADTKLEDLGAGARVKVEHGGIRLARVEGSVVAESSFDDTVLEDVAGQAEVTVTHGGIRGKRLQGAVTARTDGDDINLEGFRGAVRAEAKRGSVRLTPEGPVATPVSASASYGNVRLLVPDGSRLELEASTSQGELRVALPGLAFSEQSKDRVSGRLGDAGPRVELRAEHGDVWVSNRLPAERRGEADEEDE